jgi:hypothetical protein
LSSNRQCQLLTVLLGIFVLAGCAPPPSIFRLLPEPVGKVESRLFNLRIERWGEIRFSGLLALQQGGGEVHYALLDASGVKLLQARVNGAGESQVLHAKGALKDSSLAPFLGEALARIFLQEPKEVPCDGRWWQRLCRQDEAMKSGYFGPLLLWRADVPSTPGGAETISYHQPWLGVGLVLRPVLSQ